MWASCRLPFSGGWGGGEKVRAHVRFMWLDVVQLQTSPSHLLNSAYLRSLLARYLVFILACKIFSVLHVLTREMVTIISEIHYLWLSSTIFLQSRAMILIFFFFWVTCLPLNEKKVTLLCSPSLVLIAYVPLIVLPILAGFVSHDKFHTLSSWHESCVAQSCSIWTSIQIAWKQALHLEWRSKRAARERASEWWSRACVALAWLLATSPNGELARRLVSRRY